MGGSLNLMGGTTEFNAQTALNNLGVSQTNFSASVFINIREYGSSASNIRLVSFVDFLVAQPFIVDLTGGTSNELSIVLQGVSSSLNYNWPIVLNQTVHIVVSLNSSGTSFIMVDGSVVASGNALGLTRAGPNAPLISWASTAELSALIAEYGIWNNYSLTQADGLNLRDGTYTAATLPTQAATSYWLLAGTAGANPVANDAGMTDQMPAGNNFITINNPTGATYSATSIPYISPILVVEDIVTRSGSRVKLSIGTNPIFGTSTPIYPTKFNANPTFELNGVPVSAQGPYNSWRGTIPHVTYQLYNPGTPPQNIVIAPTDVVTWSVPDNWIGTSTQLCPAQSGTCSNYADAELVPGKGQYEPPVFGYSAFNPADNPVTFALGFNVSDPGASSWLYKNRIHNTGPTWSGAATSTPDGMPQTMTSAGGSVSATIWNSSDSNGLSTPAYGGFPCPIGTYTFVADDTNAASSLAPMSVTLTSGIPGVITTGSTNGGTLVGTTQTNKWWQWSVTQIPVEPMFTGTLTSGQPTITGISNTSDLQTGMYVVAAGVPVNTKILAINNANEITLTANATANGSVSIIAGFQYNLALTLTITAPSGSKNQTLINFRQLFNIDDFNEDDILAYDDLTASNTVMGGTANNPLGMFTSPGPAYPSAVRRLVGSDGCSQIVSPSDLCSATTFSWQPQAAVASTVWPTENPTLVGPRVLPIYSVQQYSLANNPKVFFADHYINSQGADLAVADSTYPLYPYAVEPANVVTPSGSPALGYDWMFPSTDWGPTKNCVIQVVCRDTSGNPVPHNLRTGDRVTFTAGFPSITVINAGGTASLSLAGVTTIVNVTDNITFMFVFGAGGLTEQAAMGQVDGTQILSGPDNTATVPGDILAPVEVWGIMSQQNPAIGAYIQLNHSVTIPTVTEIATRLRPIIPPGTKVYIQHSNEIFFGNFQDIFNVALGQLGGWGTNNRASWMQRGSEMDAAFTAVWGSDAGSLVRLWQPETIDAGDTTLGMTYANQQGIGVDGIVLAPYVDMDTSPSFVMGAAQIYANNPASVAYLGSVGVFLAMTVHTGAAAGATTVVLGGTSQLSLTGYTVVFGSDSTVYTIIGSSSGGTTNPTVTISPALVVAVTASETATIHQPAGFAGQVMGPIAGYVDDLRHYFKYNNDFNTTSGQLYQHYAALLATQYGTGSSGKEGFTHALPIFGCYECNVSTIVEAGVSLTNHLIRPAITADIISHFTAWELWTTFWQSMQQWGAAGMPGFAFGMAVGLQNELESSDEPGYICSDGSTDNGSVECWSYYDWQSRQRGYGLAGTPSGFAGNQYYGNVIAAGN